jgi:predicted short-subunit dehydrogenase-like oxidoreductase (DUF2520 family)
MSTMTRWIQMMNFNLIGAGRLGKNLGRALTTSGLASLQGVCNLHYSSACHAVEAIGFGKAVESIQLLPEANIYFITTDDDAIEAVANQLANQRLCKPGNLIIHCSGVLNSSILQPLIEQGCATASIHPLKPFPLGNVQENAFNQVYCTLEGDVVACNWLHKTFSALGARLISVNPEKKASYHAAAAIASNYLITLAYLAEELFVKAGVSKEDAKTMIVELMQSNLNNVTQASSIEKALTGPLLRGDTHTLSLHLQSIENLEIQNLYKAAGLATLPMTTLSNETQEAIRLLLTSGMGKEKT